MTAPAAPSGGGGNELGTVFINVAPALTHMGDKFKAAGAEGAKSFLEGFTGGMKTAPTTGTDDSVLADVIAGKPPNVSRIRTQAQKVGKEVGTGIGEGVKQSPTKLDEAITDAVKPKETGKKIGGDLKDSFTDTLKDMGKGPMAELTKTLDDGTKAWRESLLKNLGSGDIKGAFGQVGDVVKNTTGMLDEFGKQVGVDLSGITDLGNKTSTAIGGIGEKIQGWVPATQAMGDSIRAIGSGDASTRLQSVDKLIGQIGDTAKKAGFDIGGVTGPLQEVANTAVGIAATAESVKALAIVIPGLEAALSAAAPYLALLAAVGAGGWFGAKALLGEHDLSGIKGLQPGEPGYEAGTPLNIPGALLPGAGAPPGSIPGATGGVGGLILPGGAGAAAPFPFTGGGGTTSSGGGLGGLFPGLPTHTAGTAGFTAPAGGNPKQIVQATFRSAGASDADLGKLDYILMHESSYNPLAVNPQTGDFGIFQFNPSAGKYTVSGSLGQYLPDRNPDPAVQSRAGVRYFLEHYAGPGGLSGAIERGYQHKLAYGIYDTGGIIPGSGSGDHVPILAEPGEYFIRNPQAAKYRGLLDAINYGTMQGGGAASPVSAASAAVGDFFHWLTRTGPYASHEFLVHGTQPMAPKGRPGSTTRFDPRIVLDTSTFSSSGSPWAAQAMLPPSQWPTTPDIPLGFAGMQDGGPVDPGSPVYKSGQDAGHDFLGGFLQGMGFSGVGGGGGGMIGQFSSQIPAGIGQIAGFGEGGPFGKPPWEWGIAKTGIAALKAGLGFLQMFQSGQAAGVDMSAGAIGGRMSQAAMSSFGLSGMPGAAVAGGPGQAPQPFGGTGFGGVQIFNDQRGAIGVGVNGPDPMKTISQGLAPAGPASGATAPVGGAPLGHM